VPQWHDASEGREGKGMRGEEGRKREGGKRKGGVGRAWLGSKKNSGYGPGRMRVVTNSTRLLYSCVFTASEQVCACRQKHG